MTSAPPAPTQAPTRIEEELEDLLADTWNVLVINDEVNTFQNVIEAFCRVLEYTPEAAESKAWEIHVEGRAVVWAGSREECVTKAQTLRDGYKIDARAVQ